MMSDNRLSIVLWNVRHLEDGKLQEDELIWYLLSKHDIIICVETHGTDQCPSGSVRLPGYKSFCIDRPGRGGKGNGGVAVFVQNRISDAIEPVLCVADPRGCEAVWLRLRSDWVNAGGRSLLIGACYFAPEDSSFHREERPGATNTEVALEVFSALQSRLCALRRDDDLVLLAGDFNARLAGGQEGVQDLPDVTISDLAEQLGAPFGYDEELTRIPRDRGCADNRVNNAGIELGNVCRSEGLCVLNGRVLGDAHGALTFAGPQGGSTIDLFVASTNLYARCRQLFVFDCLHNRLRVRGRTARVFSDHRVVTLELDLCLQRPDGEALRPRCRRKRIGFDVRHWRRYAAFFTPEDSPALGKLQGVAGDLSAGTINCTQAVDRIADVLYGTMQRAFGVGLADHRPRTEHAPWWNAECAQAHTGMNTARVAAHGFSGASAERKAFVEARQRFNGVRRQAMIMFEHEEWREFIAGCRGDPRMLWKKLSGGEAEECPITDPDAWRSHFQTLLNERQKPIRAEWASEILSIINGGGGGTEPSEPPWWRIMGQEEEERRKRAADCALNTPISSEEVAVVLENLPNGKSSGPEKAGGECYRYAKRLNEGSEDKSPEINRLIPILQTLMERIRSTGDYPEQFTMSDIVPVYKRNGRELTDCNNYRGIAVGGVLAKCYASVLERRLSKFAESEPETMPIRHWCQAGFRRGLGTQHHLFGLRHFITRHARPGQHGLLVCQIDFEKAFDRVDRKLLWERLKERGVSGEMLDALRRCYDKVELRVKVNGKRGTPVESVQGVKQGCPLSPALFGLFIETFADYVDAHDRRAGCVHNPVLGSRGVPELLYADDMTLLATNRARMQFLLDRLAEYCEAFGMSLNVSKCEVMVFAGTQASHEALMRDASGLVFAGQPLPVKDRAKYLGLRYGPGFAFDSCRMELCDVGRKAAFALLRKLEENRLQVPDIMLRCFETQVRPILSYGAEVWGPDAVWEVLGTTGRRRATEWLRWGQRRGAGSGGEISALSLRWKKWIRNPRMTAGAFERAMADPMVDVQKIFLRGVVGAKLPPNRQLFAELSQFPLHHLWAQLFFGFWNRVSKQSSTLARAILEEDIKAWLDAERATEYFWAGKVLEIARYLGFDYRQHINEEHSNEDKARVIAGLELPVDTLLQKFRERLLADWEGPELAVDPRVFPESAPRGADSGKPGVTACRYQMWMGVEYDAAEHRVKLAHLRASMPRAVHITLMRFRLGCWDLDVSRFARQPGRKPRGERTCRVCGGTEVEDEMHVFLECPAYEPLRRAVGLPRTANMRNIMKSFDVMKLGNLLTQIYRARKESLRV